VPLAAHVRERGNGDDRHRQDALALDIYLGGAEAGAKAMLAVVVTLPGKQPRWAAYRHQVRRGPSDCLCHR